MGNSSWRLVEQRDNREHSMTCFRERQTVLWSVPVLLLLSGCGGGEAEWGFLGKRNSVVGGGAGQNLDVAKLVSRKAERDHLKQKLGELNRMPREALRREAAE